MQDRGKFFIDPGDVVYKGQIIGEHNKEMDIEVNVQRGKKLTNMRASGADKAIKITPAIKFSLEEALEYIELSEGGISGNSHWGRKYDLRWTDIEKARWHMTGEKISEKQN